MPKKLLLLFLTLIIFLLPIKTFAADNLPDKAVIDINKSGFSPNQIVIQKGGTVTFKNSSNEEHWPASNIHPSHAIYPEFDPKKSIPPGESWDFTFNKSGVWKFHDHLNPDLTGQITVFGESITQKPKPFFTWQENLKINLSKIYYSVFKNSLKEDFSKVDIVTASTDYPKVLGSWLKIVGPKTVMDKLLKDSGDGNILDCHQEAHNIGRISYQIFQQKTFQKGNSNCHSGYYHGAIEQFFQEQGTEDIAKKVSNLCDSFETDFGKFECLHGIGHGILAYENYSLPEAISLCKQLADDYSQSSCYGGVFMENIVVAEGQGAKPNHETKWVNQNPYFPCNAVSKEKSLQTQCYLIQTARMLDLNDYNFQKVIPLCNDAPEDMRATCFQSLGRDAAGQTLRDPKKIDQICNATPEGFQNDCKRGALYVILEFWAENLTTQATDYCKIQTTDSTKSHCYQLLAQRLPDFFPNNKSKIHQICQSAEPPYQKTCLNQTKIF